MKKLLLLTLLFTATTATTASAQLTMLSNKYFSTSISIRVMDDNGKKSLYFFYINDKYEYITDYGGFLVSNNKKLDALISNFERASEILSEGKDIDRETTIKGYNYTLYVYDRTKSIALYNTSNQYINIDYKTLNSIVEYLKTIQL